MAGTLTAETFEKLLASLDADRDRAAVKYEDLRRTLIRFFEWRRAPFPEDHTDEALNRVARKLSEGMEIKNIGGYCHQVARLVCLEALSSVDNKRDPLESGNERAAATTGVDEAVEREIRLTCLDRCLESLPTEGRTLIVEYYQDESRGRIDRRKALATTLGLNREALANRAQRLRDKLEQCVTSCVNQKLAI